MMLAQVAEEIVARQMPESQKVRILLAIVRAVSVASEALPIESGGDVERLALTNPDKFENLLRGYWLLLGSRRRAA
jgi:hypothetical protein